MTYSLIRLWVGWDFERPVKLSLAKCIARNGDNGIWPGQRYELFYQGPEDWVSLGEQEAASDSLVYEQVPAGALLWLRDHTRGREERVFTCEKDGSVRFW